MKCEEIKNKLTSYLLGDLDEQTAVIVRKHLEDCEGCRAELDGIEPTLDLLRAALAEPSSALDKLSDARKAEVIEQTTKPAKKEKVKFDWWITRSHPKLAMAASLTIVVGFLWAVTRPMLQKTSVVSEMMVDQAVHVKNKSVVGYAPVEKDEISAFSSETKLGFKAKPPKRSLMKRMGDKDYSASEDSVLEEEIEREDPYLLEQAREIPVPEPTSETESDSGTIVKGLQVAEPVNGYTLDGNDVNGLQWQAGTDMTIQWETVVNSGDVGGGKIASIAPDENLSEGKENSKVPVLGDIPVTGRLFKEESAQSIGDSELPTKVSAKPKPKMPHAPAVVAEPEPEPVPAKKPAANEDKKVQLSYDIPQPKFQGTPANIKSDNLESSLDVTTVSGRRVKAYLHSLADEAEKLGSVALEAVEAKAEAEEPPEVASINLRAEASSRAEREAMTEEVVATWNPRKYADSASDSVPDKPSEPDVDVSPQPAKFDAVPVVKKPVVMDKIYSSRTPGARGVAVDDYDSDSMNEGGVASGADGAGKVYYRNLPTPKKNQKEAGDTFEWAEDIDVDVVIDDRLKKEQTQQAQVLQKKSEIQSLSRIAEDEKQAEEARMDAVKERNRRSKTMEVSGPSSRNSVYLNVAPNDANAIIKDLKSIADDDSNLGLKPRPVSTKKPDGKFESSVALDYIVTDSDGSVDGLAKQGERLNVGRQGMSSGEVAATPSSLASPGHLPDVSPTDSETKTQEDRSSVEPAETAAQDEGEETGGTAGEGDTKVGMSDQISEWYFSIKNNPRDPNKPNMPAAAAAQSTVSGKPAPSIDGEDDAKATGGGKLEAAAHHLRRSKLEAGDFFDTDEDALKNREEYKAEKELALARSKEEARDKAVDRAGSFDDGWERYEHANVKVGKDVSRKREIAEAAKKSSKAKKKVDKEKESDELTGPIFKAWGVNNYVATAENNLSTFAIDVDTAAYTVMRSYASRGMLPPPEAVRTEEFVNFFDYAYNQPRKSTFEIHADCAPSQFGRGKHLLKLGVKGRKLGREEQRQAVITLLIDTSGSMEQKDRMGLATKSLQMLLDRLDPKDQVAIVQYSSEARLVMEHTPASEKKTILKKIKKMSCGGSTNLEKGMGLAYQVASNGFIGGGENRVILLSDGAANLGSTEAKSILKKVEGSRKQGVFCSVLGFGMGTYNDAMLEELANKGDGTYSFIDSVEEAERVLVQEFSATLNNIARDVKIQVEFNKKRVKQYRQMGYENRQLKAKDFRNDSVDAGEVGSGQSVTALYELDLNPDTSGHIGIVRVRYRRADNGKVEEISRGIKASDLLKSFDEADARFKLAACAAEYAEILRGSPFAKGSEFADVAKVLRPVALDLTLDKRVQELLRIISSAHSFSR